jgi:hypothetical protein
LGASRGTPHPCLLAAPTAAAVNNFITIAAQHWRATHPFQDNSELFLTGCCEGAHAKTGPHQHAALGCWSVSRRFPGGTSDQTG